MSSNTDAGDIPTYTRTDKIDYITFDAGRGAFSITVGRLPTPEDRTRSNRVGKTKFGENHERLPVWAAGDRKNDAGEKAVDEERALSVDKVEGHRAENNVGNVNSAVYDESKMLVDGDIVVSAVAGDTTQSSDAVDNEHVPRAIADAPVAVDKEPSLEGANNTAVENSVCITTVDRPTETLVSTTDDTELNQACVEETSGYGSLTMVAAPPACLSLVHRTLCALSDSEKSMNLPSPEGKHQVLQLLGKMAHQRYLVTPTFLASMDELSNQKPWHLYHAEWWPPFRRAVLVWQNEDAWRALERDALEKALSLGPALPPRVPSPSYSDVADGASTPARIAKKRILVGVRPTTLALDHTAFATLVDTPPPTETTIASGSHSVPPNQSAHTSVQDIPSTSGSATPRPPKRKRTPVPIKAETQASSSAVPRRAGLRTRPPPLTSSISAPILLKQKNADAEGASDSRTATASTPPDNDLNLSPLSSPITELRQHSSSDEEGEGHKLVVKRAGAPSFKAPVPRHKPYTRPDVSTSANGPKHAKTQKDNIKYCHQCRSKINKSFISCGSCSPPRNFCIRCIDTRYASLPADLRPFTEGTRTKCPYCENWCSCDRCCTRRGEPYRFVGSGFVGDGSISTGNPGGAREAKGGGTKRSGDRPVGAAEKPRVEMNPQ
ncbi:hypothetical protein CYLTODRAFT_114734 [Cylindrobasidium torrendii FP15055 ss-10]|uniref:Zinc-finger domain-containing protein n=1 Tax=Cylindrobasidium torrendii FP15055 ss-10 TaxID=1314674 RepID=A0A0D7B3E3_9AGAR|nr:hypothetical protein CYLTODRAFT_114734 [Cylindrobasidium torrendii FP15055 ss-10]